MTGYAISARESDAGTITLELKSVNSRFLDLQFRMNDDLRALEPLLREAIMSKVQRGKVECRLSLGARLTQAPVWQLMKRCCLHWQRLSSRY